MAMLTGSKTFLLLSVIGLCLAMLGPPGCTSKEEVATIRATLVTEKAGLDQAAAEAQKQKDALTAQIADLTAKLTQAQTQAAQLTGNTAQQAAWQTFTDSINSQLTAAGKLAKAMDTTIKDSSDRSTALANRIAKSDALIAQSDSPTNSGTSIGGLVGTFLPAAIPFIGFATLTFKHLKLRQAKAALEDDHSALQDGAAAIVNSIDAAAAASPDFAAEFEKVKPLIAAVQRGTTAPAIVDQAQAA